jgi:hypothetical protein
MEYLVMWHSGISDGGRYFPFRGIIVDIVVGGGSGGRGDSRAGLAASSSVIRPV